MRLVLTLPPYTLILTLFLLFLYPYSSFLVSPPQLVSVSTPVVFLLPLASAAVRDCLSRLVLASYEENCHPLLPAYVPESLL